MKILGKIDKTERIINKAREYFPNAKDDLEALERYAGKIHKELLRIQERGKLFRSKAREYLDVRALYNDLFEELIRGTVR